MGTSRKGPSSVSPKQARSKRTRERIFRAAGAVFAEKGYEGARVAGIARRAGVSTQRIYAYFGCKRELYRQVLVSVYADVANDEALLQLTEADIPLMTGIIVDRFFEIHDSNPRFWRLLCWENMNGGRSLSDEDWGRIRGSYIEHLESLYSVGQLNGVFRSDIGFATYLLLLFSTTYFYYSNRMTISRLLRLAMDRGEVRRRIEDEFLAILSRGLSPQRHSCLV